MTTKPDIDALKAASDQAEMDYKAAVRVRKVAIANVTQALRDVTRARVRYMRALGAMAEEEECEE